MGPLTGWPGDPLVGTERENWLLVEMTARSEYMKYTLKQATEPREWG